MLRLLHIENIAVIERADILFEPGFNVITGETGAGKSIVIDALSAVLGQRAYRELIRTGADHAFVSAVFSGIPQGLGQDLGIADVNNGLPATGTGTDGITFITDPKGPLFTDAGPFSELGAALAKAAYESVTECLVKYDHPWNASPLLQTPDAVDLNKLKNSSPQKNQ